MRTQLLTKLDLDQDRLREDLAHSTELHYSEPYTEFLCGRPWKSAMLWAPGGEAGDDIIAHYDAAEPAAVTPHGERLPYIREIVEKYFAVEHVTFARLAVITDSVMVPHRDYVELSDPLAQRRAAHRLHVCLATSDECLFTEDDLVYQMRSGDVWFLDVTRQHGAGVLDETRRVHLILDFADVEREKLLNFEVTSPVGIPESNIRPRPSLSTRERDGLRALAAVVDRDNLKEIFGIVIRKHYGKDGGPNFVWDTIGEIARLSGDAEIVGRVADLHKHCVLERVE